MEKNVFNCDTRCSYFKNPPNGNLIRWRSPSVQPTRYYCYLRCYLRFCKEFSAYPGKSFYWKKSRWCFYLDDPILNGVFPVPCSFDLYHLVMYSEKIPMPNFHQQSGISLYKNLLQELLTKKSSTLVNCFRCKASTTFLVLISSSRSFYQHVIFNHLISLI